MSNSFFQSLDEIGTILRTQLPVEEKLKRISPYLADSNVAVEFWRELDDPAWVPLLQSANYLCDPPPPERLAEGRVMWPRWPVSGFLKRVADRAPEAVATAIRAVRTDNPSIIADFVDAALAMPASHAASLVPMICEAARDELVVLQFKHASDLCAKLAKEGEVDAAFSLAQVLFAPRFAKGQRRPSRSEDHWYREGLAEVVSLLSPSQPSRLLPLVCDWLDDSVRASNSEHSDPNGDDDTSVVWRPAIEDHEQNRDYEFAAVLVSLVRDGFQEAISEGRMTLPDALALLEQHRYPIFSRLRLHLIAEFGESSPDLARQAMMNRDWFEDYRLKHEYARLMGVRWPLLSEDEQRGWLEWVNAGPDMEGFDERQRAWHGEDVTPEMRRSHIEDWKFKRLHWIRQHLEGNEKRFYEQTLAKRGEPQLADLHVRMSSDWGSGRASPISVEELKAKAFPDAVAAVVAWRRPEGASFMDPSVEDLARTFGEYIASEPESFSVHSSELEGKPAVFVHRFLEAMHEAIKAGKDVDVESILALCKWIVDRPPEEVATSLGVEEAEDRMVDQNWRWSRDRIADLVDTICKARVNDRPRYAKADIGGKLWEILEALCRDKADSYLQHDQNADPRMRDYLDIAINSPRGRAVSAAMEYARWIANQIKVVNEENETIPGGFDSMPEVREMLEWQIGAENRTTVAMAEIGSNFGLIGWIDRDWLAERIDDIMLLDDPPTPTGWAAWNAFLTWVRAHIQFYKLLKPQFATAVDQATRIEPPVESARNQPMEHLGQHLVLLYGRGQLGFDEDNGLVQRYVLQAAPDLRRSAVDFIGNSLRHDDEVPHEIIERFMRLWEAYWAGPGPEDAKAKPESWLFGAWVWSGKFPPQWTIDQLLEFVTVTGRAEPGHGVVEVLARIAEADLLKSVRILQLMEAGESDGWGLHDWVESAEEVLRMAMAGAQEVQEVARTVIDRLGRRGYLQFGKLLQT